jgi:DNA topoisomerase-1
MSKTLVIVESPGKIKKIEQYLGPNYIVKASFGHVQDLDKKTLSIDVQNNFKPLYIITPDKLKVVNELRKLAGQVNDIILAADGDREGEAIAWSLAQVLKLSSPKRIVFNEITKTALQKAISNPTVINENMVNAQQTRRLLDRLVGYLISPVLWKYITSDNNNSTQSAGRVQSVVVKILVNKEEEIKNAISEPYIKTVADFYTIGDDFKMSSLLNYNFEDISTANEFLLKLGTYKKVLYKVVSVENKQSSKKPSLPFITSSLQQDASTKLHFSVKKTMEIAQKLYEAGLITYMRTDSPNISKEAQKLIKDYIISNYGEEYSEVRYYESKNNLTQDAHECIRPTDINKLVVDNDDMNKLYNLIWKRTVASQMSNAKLNIQTILIDAISNKKSLLNFDEQRYFISTLETVLFDGFLKVYSNNDSDSETSDIQKGKLNINKNDELNMKTIKSSEEFTNLPLRYNEANLVKHLEKNGIGRPSTYASIISKVIDRGYVEVKNIEGIKKETKQIILNEKYNIREIIKDIYVGKENRKMVPTEIGKTVNKFMNENFVQIMDIEFTARLESYLDMIAEGKANWITILKNFYDMFNPIVENLSSIANKDNKDKLLGVKDGLEIYSGVGKFGPYVKIQVSLNSDKWRYASSPGENITLEEAIKLLDFPIDLGKIGMKKVSLNKGPYGLYLKIGTTNISIKDKNVNISDIDLEYAKKLLENNNNSAAITDSKVFKLKDKTIFIHSEGQFGPYIQISGCKNNQNIPIPKKYDAKNMSLDNVLELIASKNGTKKQYNK